MNNTVNSSWAVGSAASWTEPPMVGFTCLGVWRWGGVDGTVFSERLWADAAPIYASILEHPFITGLTDGSLAREKFRYFIVQDAHYLRGFAQALAVCAAKAPDQQATVMFAEHAAGAIRAEQDMHVELASALGLEPAELPGLPVGPTTVAYRSYLLATVYGGSFAEALGAVLPCYWVYARVGQARCSNGPPPIRSTPAGSACTAARNSKPR
jgi:thiaminase/transcriptional activator TenA